MLTMAYVHPRERQHDAIDVVVRNAARLLAVIAYAAAVVIAVLILAPVAFDGSEATVDTSRGPATVTYTTGPGDTPAAVAAGHGIPLAELYALNPELQALPARGEKLVVGLR
jgi:hypothetical protein